jgi:hypothetical protein
MSYRAVKTIALQNVAQMVSVAVYCYLLLGQHLSCLVYGMPWDHQITKLFGRSRKLRVKFMCLYYGE